MECTAPPFVDMIKDVSCGAKLMRTIIDRNALGSRREQAARTPAKSSMGPGSGRAIMFIAIGIVLAIAGIWFAIDLMR